MLNADRLRLAIKIQGQSYQLLQWIGKAIEEGKVPVARAENHSNSPDAAFDWIEQSRYILPPKLRPAEAHTREFANFFWTYVTTSFDVVANPGKRLQPGDCGCMCPLCARITNAPHLQPKKLTKADKLRADELMVERASALANEEGLNARRERIWAIVHDVTTRRFAAFSTYGHWLIQRLAGQTDGAAVLALWREIAWSRAGSPIQGFSLQFDDFELAERALLEAFRYT
jgi:hypothetical protein